MRFCFPILSAVLFFSLFVSCSNEIDVLAPYEENASVYALLDPNQSVQFIKINKVFINPGARASDVAGIADSLYFDTLSPVLTEAETGRRIPLTRANVALKDSGLFASSPNYLYVTTERIFSQYRYLLEFELPGGKKISSLTNVVYTPFVSYPVSPMQRILTIQNTSTNTFTLQFLTPRNGKIFDAYLYFNYTEINKSDTNKQENKTVAWRILRSYRSLTDRGSEFVTYRLPGNMFFNQLLGNIPENPAVTRRFRPCEFMIISGNTELDNYIQASTPSIGIVQKQSEYSNIRNGIGIFASRNTYYLDDITLSEVTRNVIVNSADLRKLGFVK